VCIGAFVRYGVGAYSGLVFVRPGKIISGAQTAFYSLNPDRDIPGPLAINPAYIKLAANHITA
jgi:hypothetical protein